MGLWSFFVFFYQSVINLVALLLAGARGSIIDLGFLVLNLCYVVLFSLIMKRPNLTT